MTIFLIITELITLLLLLSMIYSLGQLSREYREKITQLTQNYLMLEHKLEHLERKIISKEGENGNTGSGTDNT